MNLLWKLMLTTYLGHYWEFKMDTLGSGEEQEVNGSFYGVFSSRVGELISDCLKLHQYGRGGLGD